MTDEAAQILERYIDWLNCDEIDAIPLNDWLATDIVRMIELMDAELQSRAYAAGEYNPVPCCGEEWNDE